jgi:hypothetical protein
MKNIFLLLIFSSLFILSCKEKSKENKSSTISVEQPKNFNDSGKISKLQNGCNLNRNIFT